MTAPGEAQGPAVRGPEPYCGCYDGRTLACVIHDAEMLEKLGELNDLLSGGSDSGN